MKVRTANRSALAPVSRSVSSEQIPRIDLFLNVAEYVGIKAVGEDHIALRLVPRPLGSLIVSDDDPAGVEVVIQRLGLAQKLRAEQNIVGTKLLADIFGVSDRDRGFYDDGRLVLQRSVLCRFQHKIYDRFHRTAVKKVLLGIIIRRRRHNDKIRIFMDVFMDIISKL